MTEESQAGCPTFILPEQDMTEVCANDRGYVVIKQTGIHDESVVLIHPVFLEKFIKHLRLAKKFMVENPEQ